MPCSDRPSLEMKDLSQETSDSGKVGLGSFENPYIGSTHPHQQNHLPSLPITMIPSEMRQANCVNPKPCTYSQMNGTTQPGIKTDSDHKDNELALLKNDKVNNARNRCAQFQIYLLVTSDKLLHTDTHLRLRMHFWLYCL